MHLTGLGWEHFTPDGIEFWGKIGFLKAGLVYADLLTTVSPTYAREIQTEEMGHGLDGVLRARADRLVGILNGIDVDAWNPQTDPYIPKRYGVEDLSGKAAAKAALQRAYKLPARPDTPLIGVVTRLAEQKGCDLLAEALPEIVARGAQFVLLGSGDPAYEDLFRNAAKRHPSHVGVTIAYDDALAHLVEAGSDLFLMPSRYEPCGLNQMMSLRYGTVPVVRATGGLADTVVEAEPDAGGNGFVFVPYETPALVAAVDRALARFRDAAWWRALQVRGMSGDFSWDTSARHYVSVYRRALALSDRQEVGASIGVSLGTPPETIAIPAVGGPADMRSVPLMADRAARAPEKPGAGAASEGKAPAKAARSGAKKTTSGKGKGPTRRPGRSRDG
jgi:starch synthase